MRTNAYDNHACLPACLPAFARGVFPLTSLGAFLVHDAVAALTALDRILRLDKVVRSTVCTTRGFFIEGSGIHVSGVGNKPCNRMLSKNT